MTRQLHATVIAHIPVVLIQYQGTEENCLGSLCLNYVLIKLNNFSYKTWRTNSRIPPLHGKSAVVDMNGLPYPSF